MGREKLRELVTRIGQKNLSGALDALGQLLEQGKEMEQILAELLEYFRALLLYQADREYQEIYLTDTREALAETASLFTSSQIVASVERIHEAIRESKYSLRKKIVGNFVFLICAKIGEIRKRRSWPGSTVWNSRWPPSGRALEPLQPL